MSQVQAIRALRWNYRWRGVRVWLGARHPYRWCGYWYPCSREHATWTPRGWWLVLRRPSLVVALQAAIADGVIL